MYQLRPLVNLQIMKNIYDALFYSRVIYGIQVWGNACDMHIKEIPKQTKELVAFL